MELKKLQNGSDIRGVALETPLGPPINLDPISAAKLAQGFLVFLKEKEDISINDLVISVGRDPRISGLALSQAICSSLAKAGARVLDAGLASTPAMFMSTVFPEYNCHGAIMITASHMPMERNGMKFFSRDGGLEKADISRIIEIAETVSFDPDELENFVPSPIALMDTYSRHLRNIIIEGVNKGALPLEGIKITVDAGNGAGGFYAKEVLQPLGADISSSQFLEPDGTFPNHMPNPEDRKAMEAISQRVKEAASDLGIIFDTDVDRASAVDEKGKEIAHNGIVAAAAALIAKDHPGTTVVTDSVTSIQLKDFLENKLGLKHLRYKRGYRNVIGKAIELNNEGIDSQLAIETSGHAAFKENYFLDDGAYLATLIVIYTAKLASQGLGISHLIQDLQEPLESLEFRLPFKENILEAKNYDFSLRGDVIIDALKEAVKSGFFPTASLEEPNYEGVRINFKGEDIQGWALLRKSLHDPLMPLNIEASCPGGAEKIADLLGEFLKKYEELDISALE